MKDSIFVYSLFDVDPHGHGGCRRTSQIDELIQRSGFNSVQAGIKQLPTGFERYVTVIKSFNLMSLLFAIRHNIFPTLSLKALAFFGLTREIYRQEFNHYPNGQTLVWEITSRYIFPYVASEYNHHVIAVPHNLESFIFYPHVFTESLDVEIKALSSADSVFCISREEQWLLKLHGIDADFLPYYPPSVIVDELLTVRNLRLESCKDSYLIFGSAKNPPTFAGMLEQIQYLSEIRKTLEFQVNIVGYGTEILKEHIQNTDFQLYGSVSSDELKKILTATKAVLIHQVAGVGALTRIPEMLIAGVPVIANGNACRSAFEYDGVYCYEDKTQLKEILSKPEFPVPEMFPRPKYAEKRFIKTLQKLNSSN
jgi:hypothetical protein